MAVTPEDTKPAGARCLPLTHAAPADLGLTLVVGGAHRTITLVVGHAGPVGAVDGELQVVGSQPVPVCVGVGEETTLHMMHKPEMLKKCLK